MCLRLLTLLCMNLFLRTTTALVALVTCLALTPPTADEYQQGINWAANNSGNQWLESPIDDAFYQPPPDIPTTPGTLIRTEPAPHIANLFGPDFPGFAQTMLYSSTDQNGNPVAVAGYVIEPTATWTGPGPTPTIVFAPGTRGQGDICAPSRGALLSSAFSPEDQAIGFNYELPVQYAAVSMGIRVVMTDYIGLGTPGVHTYANAAEQAHAVLDAGRASFQVSDIPADSPLALHGYSQGGGAVAAAAEHAASYAPELVIKGTYAGAPPANLLEVFKMVDGSTISPVLGMAINGFAARDAQFKAAVDRHLSNEGRALLATLANRCIADASATLAFTPSERFIKDGGSFESVLEQEPDTVALLDRQRLGRLPPTGPILVSIGLFDDVIPQPQVQQLARDYCQRNATVLYEEDPMARITPDIKSGLNHGVMVFADIPTSLQYLTDRFNNVPAPTNCGSF